MKPKQIKIVDKDKIQITWNENLLTILNLKYLRDECPCAGCKGETILLKSYRPPKPKVITPEMYMISNIEVVGEYAIQVSWKDGHNTGIYTWDYLKELEHGQTDSKQQKYDPLL
jgi:DUF971 family protein